MASRRAPHSSRLKPPFYQDGRGEQSAAGAASGRTLRPAAPRTRRPVRVSEGKVAFLVSAGRGVRGARGRAAPRGTGMRGETPSRDKPWLEVAVLGAPNSGKTTLVRALTARAWHRLGRPAPRLRGRTAPTPPTTEYETATRRYHLFNWPGEPDRVRGLLDRLGGLDGAVLVASSGEDLPPLTRRHVWLARQLGVPYLSRSCRGPTPSRRVAWNGGRPRCGWCCTPRAIRATTRR